MSDPVPAVPDRPQSDGPRSDGPRSDGPRYGERMPAPQYGEYATPQDQAKASGSSYPPLPEALTRPLPAPDPVPDVPKRRRWDVVLTSVLVAIGAFTTVNALVAGPQWPSIIAESFRTGGFGDYTSFDLARTVGIALGIVHLAFFVVSFILVIIMLRAGRVTFWVPLTAGAIVAVVTVVLVVIAIAGDPAFGAYVSSVNSAAP